MSKKEDIIEMDGIVLELLPRAEFRVKLDNDYEIIAYTAGKMRKNRIRVLANDRVTVEISSYDVNRGRVVQRHKVKNKFSNNPADGADTNADTENTDTDNTNTDNGSQINETSSDTTKE